MWWLLRRFFRRRPPAPTAHGLPSIVDQVESDGPPFDYVDGTFDTALWRAQRAEAVQADLAGEVSADVGDVNRAEQHRLDAFSDHSHDQDPWRDDPPPRPDEH